MRKHPLWTWTHPATRPFRATSSQHKKNQNALLLSILGSQWGNSISLFFVSTFAVQSSQRWRSPRHAFLPLTIHIRNEVFTFLKTCTCTLWHARNLQNNHWTNIPYVVRSLDFFAHPLKTTAPNLTNTINFQTIAHPTLASSHSLIWYPPRYFPISLRFALG